MEQATLRREGSHTVYLTWGKTRYFISLPFRTIDRNDAPAIWKLDANKDPMFDGDVRIPRKSAEGKRVLLKVAELLWCK